MQQKKEKRDDFMIHNTQTKNRTIQTSSVKQQCYKTRIETPVYGVFNKTKIKARNTH